MVEMNGKSIEFMSVEVTENSYLLSAFFIEFLQLWIIGICIISIQTIPSDS
jgi:hypothetical protein